MCNRWTHDDSSTIRILTKKAAAAALEGDDAMANIHLRQAQDYLAFRRWTLGRQGLNRLWALAAQIKLLQMACIANDAARAATILTAIALLLDAKSVECPAATRTEGQPG